jgi:hypothetical protein
MTRDEVLKMTNDELDLHIAEKVTFQELARPIGEHFFTREMAIDAGDLAYEGQSAGVEWEAIQPYPVTSDISAAWTVIEAMRERKWNPYIDGAVLGKWSCSFINLDTLEKTGSVLDDSACVAICRAALLAIVIEEDTF